MTPIMIPPLAALQALRESPIIFYAGMLVDDSVPVLYEYLRNQGHIERLDLVLSTQGGLVTTARRIVLLLRDYADQLTILVPHRAKSAGTLLCLGADRLVLGPMAELGPIDSNIGAIVSQPADAPGVISAEDIRAFPRMAEDWFGVQRDEDRLQVLALVAQRFFPTSLSSFYRADKLIRQIARELLGLQRPELDESAQQRIVDQLVGGYYAHDYILTRADVRALGLRVSFASPREEALLWQAEQACRSLMTEHPSRTEGEVIGLLVGNGFSARQAFHRQGTTLSPGEDSQSGDARQQGEGIEARWEIGV